MPANDLEPRPGRVIATAETDIAMWRLYCAGHPQDAIARRYNCSQATVSRALKRVRDSIPEDPRADMIKREFALINELRVKMIEQMEAPAPPAFSQKGDALVDPRTGAIVEDLTARAAAWDRVLKTSERLAKMLGLDAPTRVQAEVAQVTYVLVDVDDQSLK